MNWSYVAGFTDADGHINLTCYGSRINPRFVVSQNTREVLEQIQAFIGSGKLREQVGGVNRKQLFHLVHEGWEICEPLKALEPFLIVKKEAAQRVLSYLDHRSTHAGYAPKIEACCLAAADPNKIGV
jgi:hypothetical protein